MIFRGVEVNLGDEVTFGHRFSPVNPLRAAVIGMRPGELELLSRLLSQEGALVLRETSALSFRVAIPAAEAIRAATQNRYSKEQPVWMRNCNLPRRAYIVAADAVSTFLAVRTEDGRIHVGPESTLLCQPTPAELEEIAKAERAERNRKREEAIRELALRQNFTEADIGKAMLYSAHDPPMCLAVCAEKDIIETARGSQVLNGWLIVTSEHVRK